jgi:hypothetical protein
LILFTNMRAVSYNAESDTVSLEPGRNWSDTLIALEPFGVAVMGGRVGCVSLFASEHEHSYPLPPATSGQACCSVEA